MFGICTETVSILYAIVFGAGDACVRIDVWSLLTAFGAFMGLVIIAQYIARKLWARAMQPQTAPDEPVNPRVTPPYSDDPNYRDTAIRSTRR